MKIENEIYTDGGKFFIKEDGENLAEIDFAIKGKTIIIEHTEVDESLSGKGIGKKLVASVVEFARKESLHIKSVCTYAKKVLDQTPDYADVYIH